MKILLFSVIILVLFLSGCFFDSGDTLVDGEKSGLYYYTKSKKKIIYKYDETLTGIRLWTRRKSIEADVSSFVVLARCYAKDKNGGYFKESKFDADGKTLKYIREDYCIDKNNLYYQGHIIENVDASSFEVYQGSLRDKYHVFKGTPQYDDKQSNYYLPIVEGADPEGYLHISGAWSKDNLSYFCYGKKINVDKTTFEIVSDNVAVDKDDLFHTLAGKVRRYKRIGELHSLIKDMYYDDKTIYNFRKYPISTIEIENPKTIKLIDTTSQVVFFVDNILYWNLSQCKSDNIDIESFRINPNNKNYATDKTKVYYNGNEIVGADIQSFRLLDYQFSKDKNNVYYCSQTLEGADPTSFEYVSTKNTQDFDFCRDKNHKWKYQKGKWIIF